MTILIIGAMDVEIQKLAQAFNAKQTADGVLTAEVNGKKIIIAGSGVGKVNAAVTTQRLIDRHSPDIVLNTGVAGGIADDISIGEVVVASSLAYHDFHPLELLDKYPPYGKLFCCDAELVELACRACEAHGIKHRTGVVVSGDCFVSDDDVKADISSRFGAACTEMEGAAIAHTCLLNSVKFAVIRAVSDFADSSAEMVNSFEQSAANAAADIAAYIINNI